MSELILLKQNGLKPMPVDKMAADLEFNPGQCAFLRKAYLLQRKHRGDLYLAFLLRTLRRDMTYLKVCNLDLIDSVCHSRAVYDQVLEERAAAVEMVRLKVLRIELHVKHTYTGP